MCPNFPRFPGKVSAPRRQGQHGPRIDSPITNLLRIEKGSIQDFGCERSPSSELPEASLLPNVFLANVNLYIY